MLGSRAALNGTMLNAHTVNGGGFVVPAGVMTCAVQVGGSLFATRRALARPRTNSQIIARVRANKRATAVAICTARLNCRLAGVRRVVPRHASAILHANASLGAQRRVSTRLDCLIQLRGTVDLFWTYRAPSPVERNMRILPQKRHLLVSVDSRGMTVPPERTLRAAPERREMP